MRCGLIYRPPIFFLLKTVKTPSLQFIQSDVSFAEGLPWSLLIFQELQRNKLRERESVEKTNLLSRSAPLEDLLQLPSLSKNLALKVRVRVFQPRFICPNDIFLILTFPPNPNLQFNFSSGVALLTIYYFCRIWLQFPLLSEWWELWFHPLVLALFFRQRRDMESWADSGPFSHL